MSKNQNYLNPDVSFVVPCYNEEELIGYTLPRLHSAFEKAGYLLELIAVDNGSTDRTGEIIKELAARFPSIVYHRVEVNQGYGFGIISGIAQCTAPWIGMIPADGQVDAEDVVRLYEAVLTTNGNVLGKVRRRFRMDGLYRKAVSASYNMFVRLLYPNLESIDVNGSPKLLPAHILKAMKLESKGWLLDPEIMIKAYYMGVHVMELNVFARMRGNGVSHVKVMTCWEFLQNLLKFRLSKKWRQNFQEASSQKFVIMEKTVKQVVAGKTVRQ
jgi:glycosyltransferase involved in cell wall biosynthesis